MKNLNLILKNNWYLHALIVLAVMPMSYYSKLHPEVAQFGEIGDFWKWFITLFVTFCAAEVWEWGQRKFYGAHQGESGWNDSQKDVLATVISALAGLIIVEFYYSNWLIICFGGVIGILHLYKKLRKH